MSSRRSSDCQASSFWGSSTIWASLSARLPQLLRHQLCDDYVIRSVLLNRPMTPKPRSRRRVSRRRLLRRLPRRPRRPSRLPVPNRGPGRSPRLVLAPVLAVAPSLVAALQHVPVRLHVRVSSNPPALHPSRSPRSEAGVQADSEAGSECSQAPRSGPEAEAWRAIEVSEAGCPSGAATGWIRWIAFGCSSRSASGRRSSYRSSASRK